VPPDLLSHPKRAGTRINNEDSNLVGKHEGGQEHAESFQQLWWETTAERFSKSSHPSDDVSGEAEVCFTQTRWWERLSRESRCLLWSLRGSSLKAI